MNRYEKQFATQGEARLKYLQGEFQVLQSGTFVRCAVTGQPIPLEELRYWNVDLQEPYANSRVALERYRQIRTPSES